MKIIIVGGTGTLGAALVKHFAKKHEIIIASSRAEKWSVDITTEDSISTFFEKVGQFDALISAAGQVAFAPLTEMTSEQFHFSLHNKLMGQINLVRLGIPYLRDGGSFTLTSGILNRDPIRTGTAAAMVNGAIEGFVQSAAWELPRQLRLNAVSPSVFTESLDVYGDYFPGFVSVPVDRVALAYQKSVEGIQNAQIFTVFN